MCLAKAYVHDQMVLEDVARVRVEGKSLILRTLFGEQKEIEGIIREIDFQGARVIIEKSS